MDSLQFGLTMLLGGLWHGAAWNFVIWGAFHGAWLIVHRALFRDPGRSFPVPKVLSGFVTFNLVCLGWMAFRAESIAKLGTGLRQLADFHTPLQSVPTDIVVLIALAAVSHVLGAVPRLQRLWAESFLGVKSMWYVVVIVAIFLRASDAQRFIYFQF